MIFNIERGDCICGTFASERLIGDDGVLLVSREEKSGVGTPLAVRSVFTLRSRHSKRHHNRFSRIASEVLPIELSVDWGHAEEAVRARCSDLCLTVDRPATPPVGTTRFT